MPEFKSPKEALAWLTAHGEQLIDDAVAAGKIVESRRAHYREAFAKDAPGTKKTLAALHPVPGMGEVTDEGLPAHWFRGGARQTIHEATVARAQVGKSQPRSAPVPPAATAPAVTAETEGLPPEWFPQAPEPERVGADRQRVFHASDG
jgi:hypothetical protein